MMLPRTTPAEGRASALDGEALTWRALSDPSRRRILDLLRRRSMTTGELCRSFEFSRFAVMKHLKALEKGSLVVVERRGRERINHLNPVPIQAIYRRWIKPFERLSADRLLRLKGLIEASIEPNKEKK